MKKFLINLLKITLFVAVVLFIGYVAFTFGRVRI